jgi:hypothetical protein
LDSKWREMSRQVSSPPLRARVYAEPQFEEFLNDLERASRHPKGLAE